MKRGLLFYFITLCLLSCQSPEKATNKEIKTIVCTTSMLGDAVENIVDKHIEVVTLMGPGVDPHLYKATQGDLKTLSAADIIVYNGLHLEGKMGEIFKKLKKQKHIIVAADAIPQTDLINNTAFQGAHDPHLWFDVTLWRQVVKSLGNKIASLVGDSLSKAVQLNTKNYAHKLQLFNQQVVAQLNQLPSDKKILITAHDAFGYFGRAYHFKVRGLQGISTTSEYGLRDVSDLVNFIVEHKINAVFVESSVSEKSLRAVVEGCKEKGHQVKIGGQLYSDAMGESGTPEGTYMGMVTHNIRTIISGLQ